MKRLVRPAEWEVVKSVKVGVELPEELHLKFKFYCIDQNAPMTRIIREQVIKLLEEQQAD